MTPELSTSPSSAGCTVLVLPFASRRGSDGGGAHVAEGVSDELIAALSQLPGLAVIGRGTAATFRGTTDSPATCAAAVGATVVISGAVDEGAQSFVAQATIERLSIGEPSTCDAVTMTPATFTAGVAEIAERVAEVCGVTVTEAWRTRVRRPVTDNPEAFDLYLMGRYHSEQRPIGVKLAMQCFDRAIRLDGAIAGAFGGLALLWANFGIFLALPARGARDRAREQARRALLIDPDEPLAIASLLANATFYEWDLAHADALGAQLLASYPSLVLPRQSLLYAHAARGHADAVRELGREVQRLDPRSVDPVNDFGFALLLIGDAAAAVAVLEPHAAFHPAASEVHRRLGLALLEAGDTTRAVEHLERSVALSRRHAWGVANLACARARAGDVAEARTILAELEERGDGELVPSVALAAVHASLGEPDAAFAALDKALEMRDYWLLALDADPLLAPLRADPRFADVRARLHTIERN